MPTKKTTAAVESAATVPPVSTDTQVQPEVAPRQKPDVGDAEFCVYIGPTINGVIQAGTIYPNKKTDTLQRLAAVEKYPLIADLIVSGDTLSGDRFKVKTPGNLLYVTYQKLASGKNK